MIARRLAVCLLACLFGTMAAAQAPAPTPTPLRVITFDGGWNLPLWVARQQGYFAANGVAVEFSYTPSSAFLVTSLMEGKADIALARKRLADFLRGRGQKKKEVR